MTETDLKPILGARLWAKDGVIWFEHVIDARNQIGPRVATEADKARFPLEEIAKLVTPDDHPDSSEPPEPARPDRRRREYRRAGAATLQPRK